MRQVLETRPAPQQDVLTTPKIHQDLEEEGLLPTVHIVDTAYMSGPLMVESQKAFGVELLGPILPDTSWQAQADEGFDITHFQVDWKNQKVTCPEGQTNRYWRTGAAINLKRVYAWLNETPRAETRTSACAALAA